MIDLFKSDRAVLSVDLARNRKMHVLNSLIIGCIPTALCNNNVREYLSVFIINPTLPGGGGGRIPPWEEIGKGAFWDSYDHF